MYIVGLKVLLYCLQWSSAQGLSITSHFYYTSPWLSNSLKLTQSSAIGAEIIASDNPNASVRDKASGEMSLQSSDLASETPARVRVRE